MKATGTDRFSQRQFRLLGGLAVAVAVLMLPEARLSANTQDVLKGLGSCYAVGTDLIGSAIHKPPVADHNTPDGGEDPNFTAAVKMYKKCFSKNFRFNIILSSGAVIPWESLIPNHAAGNAPWLQWANFVNNAFRGSLDSWDCPTPEACNTNRYESTQHQLGTMMASVNRDGTGFLQSYLTATHTFHIGPDGKSLEENGSTGFSVAYGTYQNEMVKENRRWKIKERNLVLRRGMQVPQPTRARR